MGQAAKYAILGAALAVLIVGVAAALGAFGTGDALSGLSSSVNQLMTVAGPVFRNVRGALNYVFGTSLVTLSIPFWIFVPITYLTIKLTVGVVRFLNQ